MNSSAFFPTLFVASATCPSTSAATFYEGNLHSSGSSFRPDGLLAPQSSTWSHTAPLGWSYPDSETTSISDIELYRIFLSGELAYTETFPHEPYIDSSIHPGPVHTLAHDTPYSFPVHTPPHGHGYAVSTQYDAFNLSTSQPTPMVHSCKQSHAVAAPLCIAPALIESPMYLERDLGPFNDETASYVTPKSIPRTRATYHTTIRASSDSPSPYASPSPEQCPQTSTELIACQRRNVPASPSAAPSSNRWKCPHCLYIQRNRRSPDLKRHIETHTRGAHVATWVCCGVPAENAIELGVPSEVVRDAPLFDFDGMTMVGGCRKVFSRRDALIRHLRKRKGGCYGDAAALYQPGNRIALHS